MRTPKTDRKRGEIYRSILEYAGHVGCFTFEALTWLTHEQAVGNLRALALSGRLRIVKPGKTGHGGSPTVYAATPLCNCVPCHKARTREWHRIRRELREPQQTLKI